MRIGTINLSQVRVYLRKLTSRESTHRKIPASIRDGSKQSQQYNGDVGAAGKPQKAQHYSQNFADFNFYSSKQPMRFPT